MTVESEIPEGAEILTKVYGINLYLDPKSHPAARLEKGDWFIRVGESTRMDTYIRPLDMQKIECYLGEFYAISAVLG